MIVAIDFEWEDIFFSRNKAEEKLEQLKLQHNIIDSDIQRIQGRECWEYRLWISWNRNIS